MRVKGEEGRKLIGRNIKSTDAICGYVTPLAASQQRNGEETITLAPFGIEVKSIPLIIIIFESSTYVVGKCLHIY